MDILNFIRVNEMLALAGQPSESELRALIASGVERVINIAPYDMRYSIADEKTLVEQLGAEYVFHPVDFAEPTRNDFTKIEHLLLSLDGKSTLLHCAANYRATFFYAHFARRHLGWSEAQKEALIKQVWQLDDFPEWLALDKQLTAESSDQVQQIAHVVERYLVSADGFAKQGKAFLQQQLAYFVSRGLAVELILPGFPCKSPNVDAKSFSTLPDYGEVIAIERMQTLCDDIQDLYHFGANITILSDGVTFSDLVGVEDDVMRQYNAALRTLTMTHNVQWHDLHDLCDVASESRPLLSAELRQRLLKNLNPNPRALANFIERIKQDPVLREEHDNLCSYLYNDVCLVHLSKNDRDQYLASICDKAYEMMFRGKALTQGIEQRYPHAIRLSTHRYDNIGPKFTISLSCDTEQVLAPWYAVPVLRLNGEFALLPHAAAKELSIALVLFEGRNWMYIEVPNKQHTHLQFEVLKSPRFGLKVVHNAEIPLVDIDPQFLKSLSEAFGFCLIPKADLHEQHELVSVTERFGEIYMWHFGAVHVVKPEKKPEGFVHSIEKTPLHWDLSMLPLDHERVIKDERFYASTFLLYCKTAAQQGEGQTTIVDSRNVLKLAGRRQVREWQNIDVIYSTKMTYFGGVPRVYPLVFEHPKNGELLLRYQEGSNSSVQTFELNSTQMEPEAFSLFINEVNELCYDPRCVIAHDWQDGDLLIVDNHYTLHGRLPMTEQSMSREIWRVQVI